MSRRPGPNERGKVVRGGLIAVGAVALVAGSCAAPGPPVAESTADRPIIEPDAQPLAAPAVETSGSDSGRQALRAEVTLLHPSDDVTDDTRVAAAAELLGMSSAESRRALAAALRCGRASVVGAVARALVTSDKVGSWLLEPAIAALATAPPEARDGLAAAMARLGSESIPRLAALALDGQVPAARRVGVIHALGWFRSQEAAAHLLTLLKPSRREPAEVLAAASAALERLTGLRCDRDPLRWVEWWPRYQTVPPGQWPVVTSQIQSQLLAEADRAGDELARRHVETLRELFRMLPLDEQRARLDALLGDESPIVRRFAINRLARLLRDSERVPPELQEALARRLADPSPAIRADAARLLETMRYPGLGAIVAAALLEERSREVRAAWLDILARQPVAEAIDPALRLLGDREHGSAAADVLTGALAGAAPPVGVTMTIRSAIHSLAAEARSPAHVRLLMLAGDQADVDAGIAMLDGGSDAVRRAVADGLRLRGVREPLVTRAGDPLIFPAAVGAIADHAASLADLRLLATLRPSAEHRAIWSEAIRTCAAALPVQDLVVADTILEPLDYGDPELRVEVLTRITQADSAGIPPTVFDAATARLAALLLALRRPEEAHLLLEQRVAAGGGSILAPLRFRAAVILGYFDLAAQLEGDARRWIELLRDLTAVDVEAAARLRQEVARRFEAELDQGLRDLFDRAADGLRDDDHAGASATP
jgi:hypothetical protein